MATVINEENSKRLKAKVMRDFNKVWDIDADYISKDDTSLAALSEDGQELEDMGFLMKVLEHSPNNHNQKVGVHLVMIW